MGWIERLIGRQERPSPVRQDPAVGAPAARSVSPNSRLKGTVRRASIKIAAAVAFEKAGRRGEALLTSSGISAPDIEMIFMFMVLIEKKVIRPREFARELLGIASKAEANQLLKEKYAQTLSSLRLLVLSDGAYFMTPQQRSDLGWDATEEPTVFFQRQFTFPMNVCGGFEIPEENMTHTALWNKPWLFPGAYHVWDKDASVFSMAEKNGVDLDDAKAYTSLLSRVHERVQHYNTAGFDDTCEADLITALYKLSEELDEKYSEKLNAWVESGEIHNMLLAPFAEPRPTL